ncbi:hypothetical protein ACI3L1_15480 [Deinococcus sp. SM5_A1]|uniref:hypothetical protein n=1 Tax=Deinococcus sp. SM5_A1 TaxID=3379094 RepID=UPI00385ABCBE
MSITVHVDPSRSLGPVTHNGDPRLPLGAPVGLRLADPEGISEPSATVNGVIHSILLISLTRRDDASNDVTFELLPRAQPGTNGILISPHPIESAQPPFKDVRG